MIRRFTQRHDQLRKTLGGLCFGVALFLCARGARASSTAIAFYTEGPDAAAIREMALAALPRGPKVVDASAFTEALAQQGQKGSFGKGLDGAAHARALRRVRAAAAAQGLDVVVLVRVTLDKSKRRRVRMLVVETAGSETVADDAWVSPEHTAEDRAQITAALRPLLEKYGERGDSEPAAGAASAPAAPAPGTVGDTPSREAHDAVNPDSASNRQHGNIALSLFDAEIGGDAVGRHFAYSDPLTGNLRSYDVGAVPMVGARGEVFPLVGAQGFLRDIGIIGGYARSISLESAIGGLKIHSVETSFHAGIRVRIHPDGAVGPVIGISDSLSSQSFTFDTTGGSIDGQLPSVDYLANRTAVDVRFPFGSLALLGSAGFRAVVDAGQIAARFRAPSVNGVDAEIGVAVVIGAGWEGRLTGNYERYFYSFKPVRGDAFIAGGALDEFFGGRLAIAYVF